MEKINETDRVRNEEVLLEGKVERNVILNIETKKIFKLSHLAQELCSKTRY